MSDQIQIVELLVDSGPAIAGAQAVIPAFEEVAVAAQAAAASVDKLGVSLDAIGASGRTVGTTAAASAAGVKALSDAFVSTSGTSAAVAREVKAGEDALVRQGAAAGTTSSLLLQLSNAFEQTKVSKAQLRQEFEAGSITDETYRRDIGLLEQRLGALKDAHTALNREGAAAASVIAQWPALLNASGASALRTSAAQRDLLATLESFKAGQGDVNNLLEKHPGLLSAIGGSLGGLSGQYKSARTELDAFKAGEGDLSELIAKHPAILNAAGTAAANFGQNHRNAAADIRSFVAEQKNASESGSLWSRVLQGMGVDLRKVSEESGGSASKLREFAVLLREISRGDATRFLGSLSIELRNFGILGLVFNPVVDAIALLGAGLVAATVRAGTLRGELRGFQTDINFFKPNFGLGGFTPQGLQGVEQQIVDTGFLGRSDANSLVRQSIRAEVPPDLLPQITQISEALSKLYGDDAATWAQKLTNALGSGYNAIAKFGLETHTIDASTLDDMRDLALGGDKMAVQQLALQAAYKSTADVIKSATSDGKEAAESLRVVFDHALNALADTLPIQRLRDAFAEVAKTITAVAESKSWGDILQHLQNIAAAVPTFGLSVFDKISGLDLTEKLKSIGLVNQQGFLDPFTPLNNGIQNGAAGLYNLLPTIGGTNASAARTDLLNALAERGGVTPAGAGGALGGGQLSFGNTAAIAATVTATLDALAAAPSSQLSNVDDAVRAARGQSIGGFGVGGASTAESSTIVGGAVPTALDRNTDAVKTLTDTLNVAADKIVAGGGLTSGGAISSAVATQAASVGLAGTGLYSALAQLESSGQNVTQKIADINSAAGTPAQGYFQITDPTWRQFASPEILAQYKSAIEAPFEVQQSVVSNIPLNRFGPRTVAGLQAQFGSLDTSQTIGALAGGVGSVRGFGTLPSVPDFLGQFNGIALGSSAGQIAQQQLGSLYADAQTRQFKSSDFGDVFPQSTIDRLNASANLPSNEKDLDYYTSLVNKLKESASGRDLEGAAADKQSVAIKAVTDALAHNVGGIALNASVSKALEDQQNKLDAQNELEATQNTRKVTQLDSVAQAYSKSAGAAEIASAAAEAQNRNIRSGVDLGQAEIQILSLRTAQALQFGSQRINADQQQLAADQRLADASAQGTRQLQEAQIANKAIADTMDVRTKAEALLKVANDNGTDAEKSAAQAALARARAEQDAAQQIQQSIAVTQQQIAVNQQLTSAKDQIERQQLTLSLTSQGLQSAEIEKQVNLLKQQQAEKNQIIPLDDESRQKLVDSNKEMEGLISKEGDLAIAIQRAQQEQNGFNEAIKKAADTIDTTLTTAITNAFDGQKAVDWGQTVRKVIAQIIADLANFAVIRPLIGSALSAIGLTQAAASFGGGGLFGGGAGGASGGLSLGNLSSAAGLANTAAGGGGLFGGGGGGLFGSFTNWLNNSVGATLGFGSSSVGGLTAAEQIDLGISPEIANAVVPGSLFSGTLTSALGGIGAGVGAGGLLASLTGGNPIIGSVGGGFGGLAGGLIAPLLGIGGPIGGIVGGLLGGVAGLFGNNKPSNKASGDVIDLVSGNVSGFQSSGVAQNDQTVQQISSSLSAFTKSVQQLTGGAAGGALNVQAGTRDGIKIGYSGPLGTFNTSAPDAQTAINQFELAIAQNLTGVSNTLKTVLQHVSDPSQIQAAVSFATAYDNLKKAADDAFKSISTDTYQLGPFATAMANVQKTFGDLTTQAQQFGLSLDPINAGLAEATRRLRVDFGTSLDQALNTANATDYINALQTVAKTFATNSQEAYAIGLGSDATTTGKIAQLETQQALQILGGLTNDQLTKVTQGTNPTLAAMAQIILNVAANSTTASAAIATTADSLQSLTTAIKGIEDLSKSLSSGALSGLSPAKQVDASTAAYRQQLAAVLGAGSNVSAAGLTDLTSLANAAITASVSAYGQGPQTALLRASILGGLGQVQGITGSSTAPLIGPGASTATSVPTGVTAAQLIASGQITAAGLLGFGSVQSGQAYAIAAALHAAGVPGYASGTSNTASGVIMVGEAGPELIAQGGGLSVTPISAHPGWSWQGGSQSSGGASATDPSILVELQALRAEVVALRKQTQGGQVQASADATQQSAYLANIDRKAGPGVVQPMRERAAR